MLLKLPKRLSVRSYRRMSLIWLLVDLHAHLAVLIYIHMDIIIYTAMPLCDADIGSGMNTGRGESLLCTSFKIWNRVHVCMANEARGSIVNGVYWLTKTL